MVLNEQNSACNTEVVRAEKVISQIHNMPWLKNPVISDHNNFEEKMAKNRSKKGRQAGQCPSNVIVAMCVDPSSPGPSGTVWNGNKKTTENLFPNANAAYAQQNVDEVDEEQQMHLAMEESRKMYEESLRMTAELAIDNDENFEKKSDDDDYWTKKQSNLPNPEPDEVAKPSDTNNNSSTKKMTVPQKHDCPPGRSITARKSVEEQEKQIEFTKSDDKIQSFGRAQTNVDKFGKVNGRSVRQTVIGRGTRLSEQKERSHGASYPGNKKDSTGSESYDSHRNSYRPHNNRESTNSHGQSRERLKDAGRGYAPNDRYHFSKGQPQGQRESEERSSRNNNEVQVNSPKMSPHYESSKARESNGNTLDKNHHGEETAKLRILKNDKNPEVCENSPKQSRELRLEGFYSRSNPPPDDGDVVASTSKPEVTASISNPENFLAKQETPQRSTLMYNTPPGFPQTQLLYPQNTTPSANETSNLNLQNVYNKLAINDPLLHRLLLQKQMNDYMLVPNREVFMGYENYQPEEEGQGRMMEQLPVPGEQVYFSPQGMPGRCVLVGYPHGMDNQGFVASSHPEMSYCPEPAYYSHSQFPIVENSSATNMNCLENMSNVLPRGTVRHCVPGQNPVVFPAQFQGQYYDHPCEHLVAPKTANLQLSSRIPQLAPPMRPCYLPESYGPTTSIPRPQGRPFVPSTHQRVPPPTRQYNATSNVRHQQFDRSHGNSEFLRNSESCNNRDPRQLQMRPQQSPNMEPARESVTRTR